MDVPFLNPQHTHKNPCVSMHLAKKSISKNNKSPARKDVPNYAWFHARSHWKKMDYYRSRQWHTPNNNRHCCNVAMFPGWFGPK
jgi:hypothetical protein